jgi:hypothetical protein
MTDDETLRVTVIAGEQCADDFEVIWRGMSIGRIKQAHGTPHGAPQWTWSCHVHGRPQASDERGNGADLDDAKAQFRAAWARIRASLTGKDIANAQRIAKNSAETLTRYDRRRRP